jgi:hypothetical protein
MIERALQIASYVLRIRPTSSQHVVFLSKSEAHAVRVYA